MSAKLSTISDYSLTSQHDDQRRQHFLIIVLTWKIFGADTSTREAYKAYKKPASKVFVCSLILLYIIFA